MGTKRRRRPAGSPQEREDRLISLAYDLVEEKLINGTATSQETTMLLKAGTERERLERKRLENENLLLSGKYDQLQSAKKVESLIEDAIEAMQRYGGHVGGEEVEYDDWE